MPDVSIGRREKRRIAQYENNSRLNSIYSVKIKGRSVRSPRTLYNLNLGKKICGEREKDKKNF
jgi:hypothetical protein